MAKFENDVLDLELKKKVGADAAEAAKLGVTGTPGFFVNGRFLRGAKPFADFATVINEELQKKGLPIPAGCWGQALRETKGAPEGAPNENSAGPPKGPTGSRQVSHHSTRV
jgi:hypothetical protein